MRSSGNNFFKYIFILVVIGLIGGAVYILYYSNNSENEVDIDEENVTVSGDISIVENIKMGISNFDTMNPILTKNREIINIDKLVFDSIFNITSDYRLETSLGKSISKNSDTSYEVKLDSSIKWQDGSTLIATDVKYTIEQIKNTNSIYLPNVQDIASVETPDSETVIFNLTRNIPFFEYNLTFPIVSSRYYINEDFANSGKIPMGTGMYKIASINDDNILLIMNDKWKNFKTFTPRTQSITLHKYNAIGEIFNTFKLGNIDIVNTYMTNYNNYVGTIGYNKKEYAGRDYDFLSFNCNDNILADSSVRKAIAYAINKDNIVSTIFEYSKVAANAPLDYGSFLYNGEGTITYNQDMAKKTLMDGGWSYTNNRWQKSINGYVKRINLSLVVNASNPDRVKVANNLKSQLAEVGILINVVQVNDDRYYNYLNNKDYQLILTGVSNSVSPDLTYFYGNGNISNYYNGDLISKLYSIDSIKEAQKIANEEVPHIGLYRNKGTIILNSSVGGDFAPNWNNLYYNFDKWYRQQ